jgi:hypothetical protein
MPLLALPPEIQLLAVRGIHVILQIKTSFQEEICHFIILQSESKALPMAFDLQPKEFFPSGRSDAPMICLLKGISIQ